MAPPHMAPVDRLVATAEKVAKEHPETGASFYTLARVHYLAFSSKRDQVAVQYFKDGEAVNVGSNTSIRMLRNYNPPYATKAGAFDTAALFSHASAARENFAIALKMEPKNALYQLGLASLLDEVRTFIASIKPGEVAPAWAGLKPDEIRKAYEAAFDLALTKDLTVSNRPLMGLEELISYEAGQALIRLAEADPAALTAGERAKVEEARAALAKFAKLPPGPVTPIVLSLKPTRHLEEMLAPEVTVDFDLRGYGFREHWPWVKPELGILVWDPLCLGQVQSARDLFGSYSFQIFRKTGYEALAALDDNGDGQLAGEELNGIRVWFDVNSDGVSTASEVKSLDALGITAIAVRQTTQDGIHPTNPAGLRLRDGHTLPTWDWMTNPEPATAWPVARK